MRGLFLKKNSCQFFNVNIKNQVQKLLHVFNKLTTSSFKTKYIHWAYKQKTHKHQRLCFKVRIHKTTHFLSEVRFYVYFRLNVCGYRYVGIIWCSHPKWHNCFAYSLIILVQLKNFSNKTAFLACAFCIFYSGICTSTRKI